MCQCCFFLFCGFGRCALGEGAWALESAVALDLEECRRLFEAEMEASERVVLA